jgi:hypothetical protein
VDFLNFKCHHHHHHHHYCHHHCHQSSAVFCKPHLFPEIYKISVNVCKDIIKLNIYKNKHKNSKFCTFQHFILPSLSGGQIQSVGVLGWGPLRHVPPPWHGLAQQGAVFRWWRKAWGYWTSASTTWGTLAVSAVGVRKIVSRIWYT